MADGEGDENGPKLEPVPRFIRKQERNIRKYTYKLFRFSLSFEGRLHVLEFQITFHNIFHQILMIYIYKYLCIYIYIYNLDSIYTFCLTYQFAYPRSRIAGAKKACEAKAATHCRPGVCFAHVLLFFFFSVGKSGISLSATI